MVIGGTYRINKLMKKELDRELEIDRKFNIILDVRNDRILDRIKYYIK